MAKAQEDTETLLRQIRGLLTLLALKVGASSKEVSLATGQGASTVRRDFPAAEIERLQIGRTGVEEGGGEG